MIFLAIVCLILALMALRRMSYTRQRTEWLVFFGWIFAAIGFFGGFRPLLIPAVALLFVGFIKRLLHKGQKRLP